MGWDWGLFTACPRRPSRWGPHRSRAAIIGGSSAARGGGTSSRCSDIGGGEGGGGGEGKGERAGSTACHQSPAKRQWEKANADKTKG